MSRGAHPELAAAIGKTILARRRELEKSQEDIAYESDMSIRQYQRLEAGEAVNALVGNVYAIAVALDLGLADFAERVERTMKGRRRR